MKKIDATVLRETCYVAGVTLILSLLMQAIFLVVRQWGYTVLLGNIPGFVAGVGNFFLMGLTVQKAVTKEEKEAQKLMKVSQSGRLFLLLVIALLGHLIPVFHTVAVILPFLFPRIAVALRPLLIKE